MTSICTYENPRGFSIWFVFAETYYETIY